MASEAPITAPVFGTRQQIRDSFVDLNDLFSDCFLQSNFIGEDGGLPGGVFDFSDDDGMGLPLDDDDDQPPIVVAGNHAAAPVPTPLVPVAPVGGITYGLRPSGPEDAAKRASNKRKLEEVELDATEKQKLDRRERNREHAKRSRIRKKFMLECLQEQLMALRKENMNLRQVVKERIPHVAEKVLQESVNERALVLSGDPKFGDKGSAPPSCLLVEPDFRLIHALLSSQQNFTVSDPSLPDNPIVYASHGFIKLTGYTMDKVIGRNCRFLQGPGTDPKAVDIIRRGIAEGRDTSVCLLNYNADGKPFWNQFFVAALRDEKGCIVNYVGVQSQVKQMSPDDLKERLKKIPLPDDFEG